MTKFIGDGNPAPQHGGEIYRTIGRIDLVLTVYYTDQKTVGVVRIF